MNQYENIPSQEDDPIDSKVVKRHFPRTNNNQVLDFVFEKDPNLFLRKNKILIHGRVAIDDKYIPECGFVAKLFGMLTIDVDSHTISSNRAKYEIILEAFF